ncbi:hypothetical protein BDV96DRAFT_602337 [Lophiotrema nucula]|uniref:arginine--tRNA ligase n=1 Tax=Lophiotrema nucula TaxID=690887 RepID=A0A6A5YZ84_9PLEO|nr:hypothetical protein BDV96DRAFT_602337 [Lophiotrema nucula]
MFKMPLHTENSRTPFLPFAKEWPGIFESRPPRAEQNYVESLRGVGAVGDPISLFMRDAHDQVSWEGDQVKNFCEGAQLTELQRHGVGRQAAWLDDRSSTTNHRTYSDNLTSTTLYNHLLEKRWNHDSLPDADRRLIYVSDLDPFYILALTETATFEERNSLQDLLWKHLKLETSMKVQIPATGFLTYRLEFHIPIFALRTTIPKEGARNGIRTKPKRIWRDVSFLYGANDGNDRVQKYGIHEAHISTVICGSSERRWTAYCFEDTDFNDEVTWEDDDRSFQTFRQDRIVNFPQDANLPIWNVREYFLKALQGRLGQVFKEWIHLIRSLEEWIQSKADKTQSLPSDHTEAISIFEWSHETSQLIQDLKERLTKTNEAWRLFLASDGDIAYFPDEQLRRHLLEIKQTSESLDGLESRLLHLERKVRFLEQQCLASAQMLQLSTTLESSQAVKLSGFNSELTIFVISPIAIVSAFFAIPQPILSFERNFKSFVISVILLTVGLQTLIMLKGGTFSRHPWWKTMISKKQEPGPSTAGSSYSTAMRLKFRNLRRRNARNPRQTSAIELAPMGRGTGTEPFIEVVSFSQMATDFVPELENLLGTLSLSTPIPTFAGAASASSPLGLYRSYLADTLYSLVDCDREAAYNSIQSTVGAENGDFAVAVPRLCPGSKVDELAFDLMKSFPTDHPLFPLPYPDGVQLRIFIKEESLARLLLPWINQQGDAYSHASILERSEPSENEPKKLLLEFSSPNACVFEQKHLRSAILGAFISELYKRAGWNVTKLNFLGDYGKPMALLERGWELFGSDESLEADPAGHLIEVYHQIWNAIQPEEQARKKARNEANKKSGEDGPENKAEPEGTLTAERDAIFKKLEEKEEGAMALFERFRDVNIKYYTELYARLGIAFDEYSGESQVSHEVMEEVEQMLRDKGISEQKEGAWVIDLKKHEAKKGANHGTVFVRDRAGSTTYLLRDLAAVIERSRKFQFDKMIFVVAADHDLHFSQITKILQDLEMSELASKLQHVHFKKASKAVEGLGIGHKPEAFLDRWVAHMLEVLEADDERSNLLGGSNAGVKALGISALLAHELSVKNDAYHPYDVKAATAFKPGAGPELQYWYARVCSELKNLPQNIDLSEEQYEALAEEDDQINLLRILAQYPDITHAVYKSLDPAPIVAYLGNVTKQLAECLTPDEEGGSAPGEEGESAVEAEDLAEQVDTAPALAAVYEATRKVLKNGLTLLGITPIADIERERADTPLAD